MSIKNRSKMIHKPPGPFRYLWNFLLLNRLNLSKLWGSIGIDINVLTFEKCSIFDLLASFYNFLEFLLAYHCPTDITQIVPGVCFVTKWGKPGSANGQVTSPHDVSVAMGYAYVADAGNNRIQVFYWQPDVGCSGAGTSIPH